MRTILARLGCLILFILLLPPFAIIIGPLLVLAAIRGYQPLGPITLNTRQYGSTGRVGAFLLGLAIWILIWSSLAWFAIISSLPAPTVASAPPNPAANPPAGLTATPLPPSPTFTPPPATSTPRPATPIPTESPVPPSTTPTLPPTASPTGLFNEPRPTSTPTPTTGVQAETGAASPGTPTPTASLPVLGPTVPPPTLTVAEQQRVIATVEEGNSLLRQAISVASAENLQKLTAVWQDPALSVVEDFAVEHYQRYAKPFEVDFEYITPPRLDKPDLLGQTVVTSQERWTYGRSENAVHEAFEFIYTLKQQDGRWIITHYTYRNLPLPTPTTSPTVTSEP